MSIFYIIINFLQLFMISESMSFEKEMEIKKKRESRRERSKFEDIQY